MRLKYTEYMKIVEQAIQLGCEVERSKRNGRFPTFLAGLAGEYLVMSWLAKEGIRFEPKGGQAGYDLVLESGAKIEVRTSLLKDEGIFSKKSAIKNYGWRLKDKGKEILYDYVFCVALDRNEPASSKCYVFGKKEVERAPSVEVKRFKRVEKRLWIYPTLRMMQRAKEDKKEYVTKWEEEINKKRSLYELKNRKKLFC